MSASVERIAGRLVEAVRNHRQFEAQAEDGPRDEAEAYQVQELVFAALHPGLRPIAWKVGALAADVEPIAAPIAQAGVYRSPARVAGDLFHVIGVEAEIAFRIGRDLPARETPYAEPDIAAAVSEAIVTLELCDARISNWKAATDFWKLADFQMNGGLVLGTGTRAWREVDFSAQRAELWVDGTRKAVAVGAHPFGSPFRLMPWTVAHCMKRMGGLRAGDVVTTGSWTGLEIVQPGASVVARFPGIGDAQVSLTR